MKLHREFNGVSKLRHYLQVVAFTLVVGFFPDIIIDASRLVRFVPF